MIRTVVLLTSGIFFSTLALSEEPQTRPADRTHLFARTQVKYGLEDNDYLSRWVDRPLYLDPSLELTGPKNGLIHRESFRRMREIALRYGLDGFAFFPETSGRKAVYDEVNPSEKFLLLTEFIPGKTEAGKIQIAETALKSPFSFRMDDKVVITSYAADKETPEYWQQLMEKIRTRLGDHFLFLPSITNFGQYPLAEWIQRFDHGKITPEDIAQVKEGLRQWARATDGLYFSAIAAVKDDRRRFHARFYEDFIIRNMKEVLAEPEFQGKRLGLSAGLGHENCTRFGYTFSSDGTKTLRRTMETALRANPALINIPEWDEQNENTSLRPTIYNSLSSMRIMRAYSAGLHGKKPEPLPGDDLSIPNLVLSYRKILTAGEKIEIEVLNIPDDNDSAPFTARVILQAPDGSPVFTSEELRFDPERLMDHTVEIPSETLALHPVLLPQLQVTSNGQTSVFAEGLHYIELRPTYNWDYKWVKQPLRDLMKCRVAFHMGEARADGTRIAEVEVTANEPIAYVEVLDNDDTIYSHSPQTALPREDEQNFTLSFLWQSFRPVPLSGTIGMKHASGVWTSGSASVHPEHMLSFNGSTANHWPQEAFLKLPKSELDQAVLAIQMPGIFEGEIPVKKIIDRGAVGLPGPDGFNLVISRYVRQSKIPVHANQTEIKFSIPVLPDLPASVLHVQIVGLSGDLYRSKPIRLGTQDPTLKSTVVYSDSSSRPVAITADSIPDIDYDFDPENGSILRTSAGRSFWGILGGYAPQATRRGGGESRDGTPFMRLSDYPTGMHDAHPDWVSLNDGRFALQFDGKGNFVTLPQGVIPRRSAFTITMDIKPETIEGRQTLISNRSYYPGSFGFEMVNGRLRTSFLGENESLSSVDSDLNIAPGKWQKLVISYDGRQLKFAVDGVTSKPIPVKGPGYYDTLSVLGGFNKAWFRGQIKSLSISHAAKLL